MTDSVLLLCLCSSWLLGSFLDWKAREVYVRGDGMDFTISLVCRYLLLRSQAVLH